MSDPAPAGATAATAVETEAVLAASGVYRFRSIDDQQVPVLRDVSFVVRPREFVTVMGPSGSGKSTLLHLLAGLDAPSAGSIRIAGVDLATASEEARAALRRQTIGFVFQFFQLLPDLTVLENVTLPLRILGRNLRREAKRIHDLLALLGIDQLANRRPMQLSGGEMQRVGIARALATEPPLVLADEPTGNLSSKAGEEVVSLLRSVRDRLGTAILLVTHNPRDAAAGDRVLFLHDGALRHGHELTGGPFDAAVVFSRLQELGI